MKIVAVIPAYNEAQVIGGVVKSVAQFVSSVVVVDDGSTDRTNSLAKQAGATVLKHIVNCGQGAALQTGIKYALNHGADVIITFDADGQFVAAEIPLVIAPIINNQAQVVLGSRFLHPDKKVPLGRRLILSLAVWVTKFYTGLAVTDTHNGFKAFSRQAAMLLDIKQNRMAHASEILEQIKKNQLKYLEVAVTVHYSQYSLQKGQKLTNLFKIFWDLFFSRIQKW
ncbi:MAG: glycosyltransferase family 2 protein [Candidatus Buchananbacteria bacterium]|nr:glycosyltransferase family 2 protein [Candidatus Buchananbacteria bacterium]